VKKFVVIAVCAVLISGCSNRYASNGEKLYLGSRNGVSVVVPPPLTNTNVSHFYDLPSQDRNAEVNIAPPSVPEIQEDQV